ncbi:MAG: hypothetical protein QNJ91_11650 [Gammaproteobacteria bacterium]|nr:hypothetical protein [Gammaproteobacteria bacterium]
MKRLIPALLALTAAGMAQASTLSVGLGRFSSSFGDCFVSNTSSSFLNRLSIADSAPTSSAAGSGSLSSAALAAYDKGVGVETRSAAQGNPTQAGSHVSGSCARASITLDDLILSGPSGAVITTSFATTLRGEMHFDTNPGGTSSTSVFAQLVSPGGATSLDGMNIPVSFVNAGDEPIVIDEILRSVPFAATVGDAFSVTLSLSIESLTRAGRFLDGGGFAAGIAGNTAIFNDTLAFVTDRPVFDLPDGFSIDSVDGLIVANRFLGPTDPDPPALPLPGTLSMLLGGALLLVSGRRRPYA